MHTALIAAALTAGVVAAGVAVTPDHPAQTSRTSRVQFACVDKTNSYPASREPGVACGNVYTGYLRASDGSR